MIIQENLIFRKEIFLKEGFEILYQNQISLIELCFHRIVNKSQRVIIQFFCEMKNKLLEQLQQQTIDLNQSLKKAISKTKSDYSIHYYLKLIAYFQQNLCNYIPSKDIKQDTLQIYEKCWEYSNLKLHPTDPLKLKIALDYSVFLLEIMNDYSSSCKLTKKAFDDAINNIEHLSEEQYKEATTIMQLLRDNLTLWTSEMQDEPEEEKQQKRDEKQAIQNYYLKGFTYEGEK
eukprot:TRINITY_DN7920_c0_g1_i1.p1 TRINITY_DN7920_c0_g1~~TRINITY_DN7920_c0_g1_i1.p1  ORF type:complete len:231 (-),score=36.70 TRINITY_DN7920_c0_g1_i1:3-695(-)